jgi:transposase InsO family protein
VQKWLLQQDNYTLHRPVRKRFLRNPYTVTNIMNVWECDLIDVQTFSTYNDKYKYLLSVIDVFSKFLNIVPLRVKTGTAVASVFRSILAKYSYRRPIWVRTDRCKEFLNRSFQDTLKKKGICFQVCRDPNVKCSVVERSHRTIRDKLYKYMTYKNTYR